MDELRESLLLHKIEIGIEDNEAAITAKINSGKDMPAALFSQDTYEVVTR